MKTFFPYSLLGLYLFVFLIPLFGAVDFAGPQWLYLSILNTILLTSFLFFKLPVFEVKSSVLSVFSFFSIFSFFSFLYAINLTLWAHDFFRLINVLVGLFVLSSLFKNFQLKFYVVSILIALSCIVESFFSLSPLIIEFIDNGMLIFNIDTLNVDAFKGVTGNRNITTASIVVKIPFIFYLIVQTKKIIPRILYSFFVLMPTLVLFLINSRAALLSLLLILIILFFYLFFKLHITKKIRYLFLFFFIFIPTFLSYFLSLNILPASNKSAITKVSQIRVTNESSSNRFELWSNALDYIYNNPFIGAGLGNWKVESSMYWGSLGENYLVPFHAHNDFLEYTTELGLVGGISFLLIFFYSYKRLLLYIKSQPFNVVVLFCSLSAYLIDASLNFPFERPIMQVIFMVILSLIINIQAFSNEN